MVCVSSEIGRLRRVIVQPPGAALDRMQPRHIDPTSADYLLFDDLVDTALALREHDQLRAVLESAAEVGRFDRMLAEVFQRDDARRFAVEETCRLERLSESDERRLLSLDPEELAATLIAGSWRGIPVAEGPLAPLPNLIFTRDLAAVAGELLIVGNARRPARRRESILTWALVDHHPWFQGARISENCRWVREAGGSFPLTIEGGDVLVASDSLAVVGASERTSWSMVLALARELLEVGFTRVLVAEMAKQRSSMHLDTVFTLLDWDTCLVYRPLLQVGGPEEVRVIRLRRAGDHVAVEPVHGDLLDALAGEGYPLRAVLCGGGDPLHERREQWTDGANFVALSPGVVVGYARNRRTAEALEHAGFTVLEADAFLAVLRRDFGGDYDRLAASGRRFAVLVTGSELSRGRGGPRCLTLPVVRD